MTYAPPPPPPGYQQQPYQPVPPVRRPWWKAVWVLPVAALFVGFAFGAVGGKAGNTKTKQVAGPATTETATATETAVSTITATPTVIKTIATRVHTITVTYTPPPPKSFGNGTYVVGTDIQAGTYRSPGGGTYCAWVRLSDLSGTGIIALGNSSGGPLVVTVEASDKGFEVQGDCSFSRVG